MADRTERPLPRPRINVIRRIIREAQERDAEGERRLYPMRGSLVFSTAAARSPGDMRGRQGMSGECRRLIGGRAGDEALSGRLAAGEAAQPFAGAALLRAFQGRRLMPRTSSLQYYNAR
jgi:hypothetical protein